MYNKNVSDWDLAGQKKKKPQMGCIKVCVYMYSTLFKGFA